MDIFITSRSSSLLWIFVCIATKFRVGFNSDFVFVFSEIYYSLFRRFQLKDNGPARPIVSTMCADTTWDWKIKKVTRPRVFFSSSVYFLQPSPRRNQSSKNIKMDLNIYSIVFSSEIFFREQVRTMRKYASIVKNMSKYEIFNLKDWRIALKISFKVLHQQQNSNLMMFCKVQYHVFN